MAKKVLEKADVIVAILGNEKALPDIFFLFNDTNDAIKHYTGEELSDGMPLTKQIELIDRANAIRISQFADAVVAAF